MKKQVLSFNEFINEAYQMIQEASKTRDWAQVSAFFSEYFNTDQKKIFADIRTILDDDSRESEEKGSILKKISNYFGAILNDQLAGQYLNVESIDVDVEQIEFDKCIMRMFPVTTEGTPIGKDVKILDTDSNEITFGKFTQKDGYMKITDFLNMVNILNMGKLGNENVIAVNKRGKAQFDRMEKEERGQKSKFGGFVGLFYRRFDKTKIEGSGAQNNYFITQATDNIEIQQWRDNSRIKPLVGKAEGVNKNKAAIDAPLKASLQGALSATRLTKKAGMALFQFVLYSMDPVKGYKRGKGTEFYKNEIRMVKVPSKSEGNITKTLVINDPGSYVFKVNSTELTPTGGQKIYTEIMTDFNTVSSIELTGYASAEGPDLNNLKLSKGRADATKDFLDEYFNGVKVVNGEVPAATDTKAIAAEMKKYVQPKSEINQTMNQTQKEEAYKPWRKISLKITGTTILPAPTPKDEERPIKIIEKIKYDTVVLNQMTISIKVELDKKFAVRAAQTKSGVRGGSVASTEPGKRFKTSKKESE
jgi:outer membrane protein OmpA-like peptidoglycan-associated protein